MNAFGYGMIWGVLGAAGGYAAAQFIPSTGCVANYTVPNGETWRVDGKRYSGGQKVNLGGGMPCTMKIAGASSVGMLMVTSLIKSGKNRGATRRYNEAVRDYNTAVRRFPGNVVASFRGFRDKAYFEATPGSEAAPQIKF